MIKKASEGRYVGVAFEALFSVNTALLAKLVGITIFPFPFASSELYIKWRMNSWFHLPPHSDIGGNTAFFILSLAQALLIFVLLRLLSKTSIAHAWLRFALGIVSLLAFPIAWFYVTYLVGQDPQRLDPQRSVLVLELVVAMTCAVLYLYKKWPFPAWGNVALLVLHFYFWGWMYFGYRFPLYRSRLIFPAVGFCSTLAWSFYSRRSEPRGCPRSAQAIPTD